MELLYIWIEEYRNIKRQGFNFSSEYRFGFDCEVDDKDKVIGGTLQVDDNPNYIPNFFGEGISNVTAIVGENGSGKSSLLDFVQIIKSQKTVFVLRKFTYSEEVNVYSAKKNHLNLLLNSDLVINDLKFDIGESYPFANTIFYSSDFDGRYTDYYRKILDVSTNNNLRNTKTDKFIFEETKRHFFFLGNSKFEKKMLFQQFPKKIIVRPVHYSEPRSKLNKGFSFLFELAIQEIMWHVDRESEYLLKINALWTFLLNYVLRIDSNIREEIKVKLKKEIGREKKVNVIIKNIFSMVSAIDNKFDSFHKKANLFFTKLDEFHNSYRNYINFLGDTKIPESYQISPISFKGINDIYCNLISYEDSQLLVGECFRFFWGGQESNYEKEPYYYFSSGERLLLNLFSRIHAPLYLKDNYMLNSTQLMLVLIDEGETGFHPQWQKQYLKLLIDFLPKIFCYNENGEPNGRKLQIILTSHSPFVVSDLPKDNVIFLKKNKEGNCQVADGLHEMKDTFGANIHTLLSDSFFMEGGLIGEFAQEKIDKLIDYLNHGENELIKDYETAQKYINIIGEPIIKRQLQKMLDSKRLQKVDNVENKVNRLEETIQLLQQEVNKLKQKP